MPPGSRGTAPPPPGPPAPQELKAELRSKDDSYALLLKSQAADVDALIEAMGVQFDELSSIYSESTKEIYSAFNSEQESHKDANMVEIKGLIEQRSKQEDQFQRKMEETAERYYHELEDTRIQAAEDYNQLRGRLNQDILNLERHMQAMTATFQLNQEKLEYNYRVLSERAEENRNTRANQKKQKHNRIDQLSKLKHEYAELDKKFQDENIKLTDKYKEITELFKDLQTKFRQFEQQDGRLYREVFAHNDSLVAELVRRVLEADKVIHEQQLGLQWQPPSASIYQSPWDAVAEDTALEEGEDDKVAEAAAQLAARELDDKMNDPLYGGMLSMLISETGFLVETRARQEIERVPADEQGRRMVKHILEALGVVDAKLFEKLVEAMTARSAGALRTGRTMGRTAGQSLKAASSEVGRADSPVSVMSRGELAEAALELVSPDDAVARLKVFVEKEGNDARNMKVKAGDASRVKVMTKRMRDKEQEYWHVMANVVSEDGVRTWKALERSLTRYHRLLKTRAGDLEAVQGMQAQNQELRALLGQYLSSKVNEELQLPPAHIL